MAKPKKQPERHVRDRVDGHLSRAASQLYEAWKLLCHDNDHDGAGTVRTYMEIVQQFSARRQGAGK